MSERQVKVVSKGSDETAYFAKGIGNPLSDLLGGNYIYLSNLKCYMILGMCFK